MKNGEGDVVSGITNKVQSSVANVTPASILASRHRKMASRVPPRINRCTFSRGGIDLMLARARPIGATGVNGSWLRFTTSTGVCLAHNFHGALVPTEQQDKKVAARAL